MSSLSPYIRPATAADPPQLAVQIGTDVKLLSLDYGDLIRLSRDMLIEAHRQEQHWQRLVTRAVKAGEGP